MDDRVCKQYSDGGNLNTRISFHKCFSTNKYGFHNWLFDQYQFFDGCTILELGCGTGALWDSKSDTISRYKKLVLSDLSEGMLMEVKTKFDNCNIDFALIDITNIPYADNTFDFVIANMMLYHVKDKDKALNEIKRVLKAKGVFYCATYGENNIINFLADLLKDHYSLEKADLSFTLQNGKKILSKYFNNVCLKHYEDSFEVTDTNALVEYFLSTIIDKSNFDTNLLYNVFDMKKDLNGVIKIPKEYGTFIARK